MGVGVRAGGEGRLACQEMEACRPVRQLAMQPWTSAAKAPCHTVPSVRRLVRTCSELRAAVWLATVTGCFFTFFLVTLACGWSSGMGGQDEVGRREVMRRQRPTQAWFEELAHSPDPVPKPSALQQQNRRRTAQWHTPARRRWPWAPRRWPPPRRRARRLPPQPRLPPAAQLHSGGSTRAITTLSQQAGPQGANQAPANQPHDPAQTRLALSASASAIGWSAAAATGAGASSSTWKSCRGGTPQRNELPSNHGVEAAIPAAPRLHMLATDPHQVSSVPATLHSQPCSPLALQHPLSPPTSSSSIIWACSTTTTPFRLSITLTCGRAVRGAKTGWWHSADGCSAECGHAHGCCSC